MQIAEDMLARLTCIISTSSQAPSGRFFLSGWFRSGIVKKSGRGRFGSIRIPSGFHCTLFLLEYLWLFRVFLGDVRVCPIF